MTFEYSKTELKKGTIVLDEFTQKTFKVVDCNKHMLYDTYVLKLEPIKSKIPNELSKDNLLNKLDDAIDDVKMHDKDAFMLKNILAQLKDSLQ